MAVKVTVNQKPAPDRVIDLSNPPMSLRTAKDEIAYQKAKAKGQTRPLSEEPTLKEWKHWRLINNRFPGTIAYQKHHMLLPKRVFAELGEMHRHEFKELLGILYDLQDNYNQYILNTPRGRSVPSHFHVHLTEFYNDRSEMKL